MKCMMSYEDIIYPRPSLLSIKHEEDTEYIFYEFENDFALHDS